MGSVKDLQIIQHADESSKGIGRFVFSDRYSVFDWGEMPDLITNKGKALCIMSAYFFEELEKMGMATHYRGLVEKDQVRRLDQLSEPVNIMEVDLVRVVRPKSENDTYNYDGYKTLEGNFLIPLEVIYRNSLPAGSSVFRRLKEGSLKLEEIGLVEMPQPADILNPPILDVSTKLEVTDRYMSWQEAQQIAALSDQELAEIKQATNQINQLITDHASRVGLINEDGKVEFGYDENRHLILVDVLGTPDECRFTFDNVPISKEVARIHYRKTDWYTDVEQAKKQDRANWTSLVKSPPPQLPLRLFELISQLYQSTCNELTAREWFASPPLKDILTDLREQLR